MRSHLRDYRFQPNTRIVNDTELTEAVARSFYTSLGQQSRTLKHLIIADGDHHNNANLYMVSRPEFFAALAASGKKHFVVEGLQSTYEQGITAAYKYLDGIAARSPRGLSEEEYRVARQEVIRLVGAARPFQTPEVRDPAVAQRALQYDTELMGDLVMNAHANGVRVHGGEIGFDFAILDPLLKRAYLEQNPSSAR